MTQNFEFPLISLFQYMPPLFRENYYFPHFLKFSRFRKIYVFFTYLMCFSFPPTLTMMHLFITQFTYWTPLPQAVGRDPQAGLGILPRDVGLENAIYMLPAGKGVLSIPFARIPLSCKPALFVLMTHWCGMASLLSCAS